MDLKQFIRKLSQGSSANESPTREPKNSGSPVGSPIFSGRLKLDDDFEDEYEEEGGRGEEEEEDTIMSENISSRPPLEQGPPNTQRHSPESLSLQWSRQEQSNGASTGGRFGPGLMPPPNETDECVGNESKGTTFSLTEMEKSLEHCLPQVLQNFSNFQQEFSRVVQTYDVVLRSLKEKEEQTTNQLVSMEAKKKALETELNSVKVKLVSAQKKVETVEARLCSAVAELSVKNTILKDRAILAEEKLKAVSRIVASTE